LDYFKKLLLGFMLAWFPVTGAGALDPQHATTTMTKVTVAVTNTYVQALAANTVRTGCLIQYIGAGTNSGWVFFGTAAPADTTTSILLVPKQWVTCDAGRFGVAVDTIWVTGTSTDVFVIVSW
jgi:hypothetical protein